jgi:hypothetical protein
MSSYPRSQNLQTGTPGEYRVSRDGNEWQIEVADNNGVWVPAEPGMKAYADRDDAHEAMETLREVRREKNERQFIDGFAEGMGIRVRDARSAWGDYSRNLSDVEREDEEQKGRDRGLELGAEYKAQSAKSESLVCGNQVQIDRSGQGHAWRDIDAQDIPASVREEIEGEMIDGGSELVASNGQHYRW